MMIFHSVSTTTGKLPPIVGSLITFRPSGREKLAGWDTVYFVPEFEQESAEVQ